VLIVKRLLFASLALTTIAAAGPVSAADMALRKAPMMAPPSVSWTGCHVGIAGGAGLAADTGLVGTRALNGGIPAGVPVPGGPPLLFSIGGFAGGQLGCDYQVNFIAIGIEAEGFWSDIGRTTVLGGSTSTVRNPAFYDVAARFGFVILEQIFLYGKLGAIWTQQSYSLTAAQVGPPGVLTATGSFTAPGGLFGIGVEYAMTNHWIARGEADLVFAMATTNLATTLAVPAGTFTGPSAQSMVRAGALTKIGLSYKF
jgi:outer membrane immunogenic protein